MQNRRLFMCKWIIHRRDLTKRVAKNWDRDKPEIKRPITMAQILKYIIFLC